MRKFKIFTNADLKLLNYPEEELQKIDISIYKLINKSKKNCKKPCCDLCDCEGYVPGNPSTTCRDCGHEWQDHNC